MSQERGQTSYFSPLRALKFPADEDIFWFRDDLHQPYPISPLGMTTIQKHHAWGYHYAADRVKLPVSKGAFVKHHQGRVYLGFALIEDAEEIAARQEQFMQLVDYCVDHWPQYYGELIGEVIANLNSLAGVQTESLALPEVKEYLVRAETLNRRNWEIHFTMMYPASTIYLAFESLCAQYGLAEEELTQLLTGLESAVSRTDDAMWNLAIQADQLELANALVATTCNRDLIAQFRQSAEGRKWLADLDEFLRNYGNRITAAHLDIIFETWRENPDPVIDTVRTYVPRLRQGWDLSAVRRATIAKREEAIERALERIPETARQRFTRLLKAAQQVYVFNEDHSFYIDSWSTAELRRACRTAGNQLVLRGLLDKPDDVFFLTYHELTEVLDDLLRNETVAIYHHSRLVLPLVRERKQDWEQAAQRKGPMFIGAIPDHMTDPIGMKVFGMTDNVIHPKTSAKSEHLNGFCASPGIVEGIARVVTRCDDFPNVGTGDILVCPYTSPAWTPLFLKIRGIVTDTGGMLTHAAICAREYGIPAVVGTWRATETINTGDLIRIDGDSGIVSILRRA